MMEKEGHGANEGTDRKKEREGRTEGASWVHSRVAGG